MGYENTQSSFNEGNENEQFTRNLAANLLDNSSALEQDESYSSADTSCSSSRVLAFKTKAPAPAEGYQNGLKVLYTQNRSAATKVKSTRHIPSAPERILDAPGLVDDYYVNTLDWGCGNMLAIGLGNAVYTWNPVTTAAELLFTCPNPDDSVCSVSWIKEGGGYLAIGTASNEVLLWDVGKGKQIRKMAGHSARVSSLDWNPTQGHLLSSGSRDSTVVNHDVRVKEHAVHLLQGHTQEVCGLKWSPDGSMLASGGNDNLLCLWDMHASAASGERVWAPKHVLTEHQAAVKALAWCPWQRGLLASGAGTADRTIKLWNSASGALLQSTDSGSQVTALAWNPHERELLSSHGFSQNQLTLWKYPTMTKIKEFTGHTSRVLHLGVSPDGSTVVSAGADESMRFWRVFGEPRAKDGAEGGVGGAQGSGAGGAGGPPSPTAGLRGMHIR